MRADGLKIEYVGVGELKLSPRNVRKHSDKQIRQIATSIEMFGFAGAIIVDESNFILAGAGRFAAAKLLKMEAVPVVRLSNLTAAQKRAFAIADNKLAHNSSWAKRNLCFELKELLDIGALPELQVTGFEIGEIQELAFSDEVNGSPASKGTRHSSSAPSASATGICAVGDLWLIGEHRLLCAQPDDPHAVGRLMNGQAADLLLAVPGQAKPDVVAAHRGLQLGLQHVAEGASCLFCVAPQALLSKKQIGTAIRNSTPPHGIVLDLFAGCGATLIEAHASGRRVYGIEQNCFAVEHALSRICALTGIEAVKKGAGQTNALALSENFGEES